MKTSLITLIILAVLPLVSMAQLPPRPVPFSIEQVGAYNFIYVYQSAADNKTFGEPVVTAADGSNLPIQLYGEMNTKDGSFTFNYPLVHALFPITVTNGKQVTQIADNMIINLPKHFIDKEKNDSIIQFTRGIDTSETIALLTKNLELLVRGKELLKKMQRNPSPFLYKKYSDEFSAISKESNENFRIMMVIRQKNSPVPVTTTYPKTNH